MKSKEGAAATAKRPGSRRKPAAPESAPTPMEITVDYPQRGERIISDAYTFRVGTALSGNVEISIDDEAWRPCRASAGYWWYDWSGYRSGVHHAVARIRPQSGRTLTSARCHFLVDIPA